jgi:hypothetical protein
MDVITMPRKNSLLTKLTQDFKQFTFTPDEVFRWSPSLRTIYYPQDSSYTDHELLHELGHAVLNHTDYTKDIDLVRIESEAWEHARSNLAPKYAIKIPESIVDELLDTYRDWLHARSLCPNCSQNGLQTTTGTYQCLNCRCQWRANEARICMLRRYRL